MDQPQVIDQATPRVVDQSEDQSYELNIRLLGNEIFAVKLSTTSTSNRWVIISLLTIFVLMTILGAYGDSFIQLYQWAVS